MKEHRDLMDSITDPMKKHRELLDSITDPMKKHRELLDSITDPMKKHRELLESVTDPVKKHRELLDSITDPMKKHRELLESVTDPMKKHRELLDSITDPMKKHRELLESVTDPMKKHRELLESVTDPMKKHRELLNSITDPMKAFRKSMAAAAASDPSNSLRAFIESNTSLRYLKDIAVSTETELAVSASGSISYSSQQITTAEIQDLSALVVREASEHQPASIEDSISNLLATIESQQDSKNPKLIMWYLYPLILLVIASFMNPVVDHYVSPLLKEDKKALAKELNLNVVSSIQDKDILDTFKYVSADFLNVRASPSRKAEAIGHLRFGYLVLIIEKQKSWTLAEWNDPETGVEITGWVFSRYLKKFR